EGQSWGSHDQLTGGGAGAPKRDGEGRIGSIGNDGKASHNTARRIRSKDHAEGEALSRDQGERQVQSTDAKGSAGKTGLGDAHAGVARIGQRCRLSGAV